MGNVHPVGYGLSISSTLCSVVLAPFGALFVGLFLLVQAPPRIHQL
jgi:hypothetical protein